MKNVQNPRRRRLSAAIATAMAAGALAAMPELNVAIFALLLNLPWEVLQARLFVGMADAPYAEAILGCVQATLGDMIIMLLAYGAVAVGASSRRWVLAPSGRQLAWFIGIGVLITAVIERLATSGRWVESWSYSPAMPVLPGIGIGLVPLLQWVLLPPLVVWFVRRQLTGQQRMATP